MNKPETKGTGEEEFEQATKRLDAYYDQLCERVKLTTSLPKMDDRGVIVGVTKEGGEK